MPYSLHSFELILFDLGGVVVELTGVQTMIEWSGGNITPEEVWRRWLRCQAVRDFESGKTSVDHFTAQTVEELGLSVSSEQFLEGFRSWIGGTYDGIQEMITQLRTHTRVGCLSNTNQIHWETMTGKFGLDALFDHHYLSHHIGLTKPDREIFEHIITETSLRPDRILFLDDNLPNVEGARSAGLHSYHVRGASEAGEVLEELGLLKVGSDEKSERTA